MDYHKEFTKIMIMLENADPNNPDVYVDGLGTYDLKTLKISTIRNIENILDRAKADQWDGVKRLIEDNVVQTKTDAIVHTQDQIEAKRRRGGRPRKR